VSQSPVRPLRVAIDARIRSGEAGGVESVTIGLAAGIATLDGDENYDFLVLEGHDDWLLPHLGANSRVVTVTPPGGVRRRLARRMPGLAAAWRRRPGAAASVQGPPQSDGTVEAIGADVVHQMHQAGFLTRIPTIYHPHDLQHRHLPQFFSPREIAWRDTWYETLCRQASMVAVASGWTKRDVETEYGIDPAKVKVVPFAPPTLAYARPTPHASDAILSRLRAPDDFVLYPAQTWPHKNHELLLRAIAQLRDRAGLTISLVASGHQNEHFDHLARITHELGLDDQVSWPGFVSEEELVVLYAAARAVVIPTRFEAASAPLWEAFQLGVPAACSTVTSLPEQAGDAALLFDPDDIEGMAEAIRRLWTDDALRADLAAKGHQRLAGRTWERSARHFRAHYRRLGGAPLSLEDRELVAFEAAL
jgi:glycosyltransferase involved in cell wall biosynthesis